MAVVILIIGLIVGGVLSGRELIKAAEIRSVVRQVEEFNVAVNAFKGKFGCLPGDCLDAEDFGFGDTAGNADGYIGCAYDDMVPCENLDVTTETGEYVNFWYHLSAANLIPFSLQPYDDSDTTNQFAGNGFTPPSKLRPKTAPTSPAGATLGWVIRNSIMHARAVPAHNFSLGIRAVSYNSESSYYHGADVYMIDSKMDDGYPWQGSVLEWAFSVDSVGPPVGYIVHNGGGCANFAVTPVAYNLATTTTCSPMIRASF